MLLQHLKLISKNTQERACTYIPLQMSEYILGNVRLVHSQLLLLLQTDGKDLGHGSHRICSELRIGAVHYRFPLYLFFSAFQGERLYRTKVETHGIDRRP